MRKHYYLSQIVGSGTEHDPFAPLTARFGPSSMLDLRPNETRPDGWCFACVECEDPMGVDLRAGLIYMGDDPHVELSGTTIEQIKECLGIDFKSQRLAEIVAEILLLQLMPGRGLRPDLEGKYRIHLRGPLWEVTEPEAYDFIGRLREDELLGPPPNKPSKQIPDLRPSLADSLATVAGIVDYGRTGWLDNEAEKVKENRSNHPLVTNYLEARQTLDDVNPQRIHESAAAIWTLMLARDLRVTSPRVDHERLSSRLRDPSDCEPTKYELYVMAGYIESGALLEKTDTGSTGEFRVFERGQSVHVECKYKSIESMEQRRVKTVFDTANDRFRKLMEEKSTKALIQVTCRTDPTEEDLPALTECISRALEHDIGETGLQFRCSGKFEVSLLPSPWISGDSGVRLPAGFDYGFTEETDDKDSSGGSKARSGWGVAWRVARPGGWMRSVVDSTRKAASQVPAESPNLIYVHVPAGSLGAVTTRIDSVAPELEELLSTPDRHRRVNAVVLTGQATLRGWSASNVATVRFIYRTVANQNPRNRLPSGFSVFGRDFTRR